MTANGGTGQGRLAGKVAVITGASTGIGAGIARLFLDQGARVALLSRRADRLQLTAAALGSPERVLAIAGDVSVRADAERLIETAVARFDGIDILVSNAGIHRIRPFLSMPLEEWREIMTINVEGTFNVVEFTGKRCHAIDARDVDAELMAAGMSLPIFLTPLRRDGKIWTDAVWIRDANVAEALRRGADEVWLVWCIGNTAYWGDGPLEQYVHMIEMSAMGALLADFEAAAAAGRNFTLHVVKPENPLPLDPEFYLNRIDADTLIGMGYRDARSYLKGMTAEGLPTDASCTAMTEPAAGIRFTEQLSGTPARTPARKCASPSRLPCPRTVQDRRHG